MQNLNGMHNAFFRVAASGWKSYSQLPINGHLIKADTSLRRSVVSELVPILSALEGVDLCLIGLI